MTVLSVHDPVRVYQDFATLDLLSGGRAEITAGRSAYPEPFALFGVDIARYDEVFAEKLALLLRLREEPVLSWRGRDRPPLDRAVVVPRSESLPVWIGAGGSPSSVARAGALGLPLILGYLGGDPGHLRQLAGLYRAADGKPATATGSGSGSPRTTSARPPRRRRPRPTATTTTSCGPSGPAGAGTPCRGRTSPTAPDRTGR